MACYAILANPGYNRIYFEHSKAFMAAELSLAGGRLSAPPEDIRGMELGNVYYLTFSLPNPLTSRDVALLSRLSFLYALFELQEGPPEALLPLSKTPPFLEEGISGMLKYSGKTNEIFTRMMLNAAALSSPFDPLARLSLLDPVAGKGTTLFEGLIQGYDAFGIEVGEKAALEACHFFKKYLETEKYKHTFHTEKLSGPGKAYRFTRYQFEFAKDKERFGRLEGRRRLEMAAGDSRHVSGLFGKNAFHLVVGDLPYGIQHGNVTNEKQPSRSPAALLKACLPGWHTALKPGGVLALSWNVFLLPREQMRELAASQGFTVLTGGPYDSFEHRVDQAIKRDVLFARKEK